MTADPILPVIDYTSRDYLALRADMIRLIQSRLPDWSAADPNDFGVAIVEAMAYGVDMLSYYLDRIANEAYLGTATQRESLYALAAMFGYTPQAPSAATVSLTFANTTATDIRVPPGARFTGTVPAVGGGVVVKSFELSAAGEGVLVGANTALSGPTAGPTVPVSEGRTYANETLAISNGFVFQRWPIPRLSVIALSVEITTTLGADVTSWTQVDRLDLAKPTDRVFSLQSQTDGSTVVCFGDHVNGEVPPLHSVIAATYRVGGGVAGNVPAHSITTVVEPVITGLRVDNFFPATGGRDAESLNSIRVNAARSFHARDRAVTLADYVDLALLYPGIAKAKGQSNNNASVTLYVAPDDDGTRHPELTEELRTGLASSLEERGMAGTTVTVAGPYWVQFFVHLTAHLDRTARRNDVALKIRTALGNGFDFDHVYFDQRVSPYEMAPLLYGIPGLRYVTATALNTVSLVSTDLEPAIVFPDIVRNALPWFSASLDAAVSSLQLTLVGGL